MYVYVYVYVCICVCVFLSRRDKSVTGQLCVLLFITQFHQFITASCLINPIYYLPTYILHVGPDVGRYANGVCEGMGGEG